MTEKAPPAGGEPEDDDGEAAFWARFEGALEQHGVSDDRLESVIDRVMSKREKERARETKKEDNGGDDDGPREPTDAERAREAGRRGPAVPSRYWIRAKGWIYGR